MSLLHSSKRPPPLKDTDYDHEISLIDHTITSPIENETITIVTSAATEDSGSSSRLDSEGPLRKPHVKQRLRKEISKHKYKKYQDPSLGLEDENVDADTDRGEGGADDAIIDDTGGQELADEETGGRGRPSTNIQRESELESAIDVLYENERGGFLCGTALFSSRALGGLDPSPWTNIAQKPSATNITNAQVPDPTWKWAWKDWSINRENDVDEDGWEYSFAFANNFSWHGPSWWNSFVRRRAWTRKRVKKNAGYRPAEAHRLNSDYFTVQPATDTSRSRNSIVERCSIDQLASRKMEEPKAMEDIRDIGSLMTALKHASIDREKLQLVENFITNGGDELCHLEERRNDILKMFVFQASRKILLVHLHKIYDEAVAELENYDGKRDDTDLPKKRWLQALEAALRDADEEVQKLEFWGDIKDLAEAGDTIGAADESQGWDSRRWEAIDNSGPKDVLSNPEPSAAESLEVGGIETVTVKERGKGKSKSRE